MPECVYFVDTEDGSLVKIGYSNDIRRRFDSLKASSPVPLRLRGVIVADRTTESELHKFLKDHRSKGEWFYRNSAVEALISKFTLFSPSELYWGESDSENDKRNHYSNMNAKLRAMEPGDRIAIETPNGMTVAAFRSTILTAARRMSFGDWRLTTRSEGRKIHCFLSPVSIDSATDQP